MDKDIFTTYDRTLYKTGNAVYTGDGKALTGTSVINESNLGDGYSTNVTEMTQGNLQSGTFETGVSGWRIDANGNCEFNDGTFRGTFNIGGTTITIDNTEDIQTNLDTIFTAGGGILYLQPGIYTLTADITIPSGVILQGVNRDGVIINCNTSYAVKIIGTNVYSTGTVTINNGDTTLEGAGTTWTSAMVGRYVLLDGLWYEITGRTDNDTITIETYQGVNLAGSAYVLADTNFSAQLNKVTVTGATGSGVVVQYAMEPTIFDCIIYGNGTGIEMDYVTFPIIQATSNENGVNLNMNFVEGFSINFSEFNFSTTGNGVTMTDTRNSTFFNSSVNDNTGDGVNITSCDKLAFISFDISGNGGQGIEFVSGCDDNQLTDGVLDGNTSDGIKLTATSDRNSFSQISVLNNGGYGINIAAATCDSNTLLAPIYSANSSGTLNDSGTLTMVDGDDTAYGASWNGNVGTPTKNAVYDKIETLTAPATDVQTFTANSTWTKPANAKSVEVVCIGAGGGGAGPNHSVTTVGGSGGGGGAVVRYIFSAADLTGTVTVTVGAAGTAGAAGGNNGGTGGDTSFGAYLIAYGGGGGRYDSTGGGPSGGSGGGSAGAGAVGAIGAGSLGGLPNNGTVAINGFSGGGAGGVLAGAGKAGEYGGGAGGGIVAGNFAGLAGGDSLFGGGGGGCGGGCNSGDTAGGNGGGKGYSSGGGGAGGAAGSNNGTAGSTGSTTTVGGTGGGGGGAKNGGGGVGGNGGAGGAPGGGGGGGGAGTTTDGSGGAGGRGQVVVITYF